MNTKEEAEFKRWCKTHLRELELEQTEAKMEEIYKKQDEKQITLCELINGLSNCDPNSL